MSVEEFEFVLAALEFIATYGQRFLPLYQFNWRTGNWTFKKKALKDTLAGKAPIHTTDDSDEVIKKYASYLETAKHIASLLPKFPPQREAPDDIEPGLLPFRV